jgi:hypothetical protein
VVVVFGRNVDFIPAEGERVKLETLLPGNEKYPGTRCLSCRAQVTRTTELSDGIRQIELAFRKASFKDYNRGRAKTAKTATTGWAM